MLLTSCWLSNPRGRAIETSRMIFGNQVEACPVPPRDVAQEPWTTFREVPHPAQYQNYRSLHWQCWREDQIV